MRSSDWGSSRWSVMHRNPVPKDQKACSIPTNSVQILFVDYQVAVGAWLQYSSALEGDGCCWIWTKFVAPTEQTSYGCVCRSEHIKPVYPCWIGVSDRFHPAMLSEHATLNAHNLIYEVSYHCQHSPQKQFSASSCCWNHHTCLGSEQLPFRTINEDNLRWNSLWDWTNVMRHEASRRGVSLGTGKPSAWDLLQSFLLLLKEFHRISENTCPG